jgi:hypothetical protein
MVSEVGTLFPPNVSEFVRLIWRFCPVGTVMRTGDHAPDAFGFKAAHLAEEPEEIAPHVYPHMGTVWPSGRVVLDGPADRLITCWPNPALAPRRSAVTTNTARFKLVLRSLNRIFLLLEFNLTHR